VNIFILYKTDTGELYGSPYLGTADTWTNIPDGCATLGPIPQADADVAVQAALQRPDLYLVHDGAVVAKPEADAMLLAEAKSKKLAVLDAACERTVLAGFVSKVTGHHYRLNRDDQINFLATKDDLNDDPYLTMVDWKTEDAGLVRHNRADFLLVADEGKKHKKATIARFWELKRLVLEAATSADVQAVNW
jgi:hypothetical protein